MTARFADTFYWIALTDTNDSAHKRAMAFPSADATSLLVATDEVLVEFLTFFATAPEPMRRKAFLNGTGNSKSSGCARDSANPLIASLRHGTLWCPSR